MQEEKVVVRRTELTTPAHSLKLAAKAAASEADEVMLDLEDACAVSQKVGARKTLVESLNTLEWGNKVRAFRPNNIKTKYFLDDMLEVVGGAGKNIDVIIIPKTELPDEVKFVDALLTHIERKNDLPVGRIKLEVLIESAKGIIHAHEIATASPRMTGLIFGVADYAGEMGALLKEDTFTDFSYAKQKTVAAARYAGIDAVDCVTLKFRDLELAKRDAEQARSMGFDGKWCIHPDQVKVVNAAFTPTTEELERAKKIVEEYRKADVEKGLGAIVIGEEMVDAATIRVERKHIAIAYKAGLVTKEEAAHYGV